MDTSLDNADIQLLLSNTFDQQIRAIDVALADKIRESSSTGLLVLQAVHQMEKELPLFNRSKAKDWTFDNGHLYIPDIAHHDLVTAAHCSFEGGHGSCYNFPSSSTYSSTIFLLYSPYLAHYSYHRLPPLSCHWFTLYSFTISLTPLMTSLLMSCLITFYEVPSPFSILPLLSCWSMHIPTFINMTLLY